MDPFNIIINNKGKQMDLNIHPQEAGCYKVIFRGELLGEIFMGSNGENWEAKTTGELQSGNIRPNKDKEASAYQHILQDNAVIQEIGQKITGLNNSL